MKPNLLAASVLTLATQLSTAAYADAMQGERWPRWYLGLSGGMQFLTDTDISGTAPGKVDFDDSGVVATASLGYRPYFGVPALDSMRIEFEAGYHRSDLSSFSGAGGTAGLRGDTTVLSYMGNVYYDFRNSSRLTPYLGAGLGGASVRLPRTSGLGNTGNKDNVFAYQFLAGLAYSPASIPLTEWSLGYRYFRLNDPEFTTAGGRITLDDYDAHSVELGAKFRF